MLQLRRTARYVEDLHAIWGYIARDDPSAADRVIRSIEARVDPLSSFPELGELQPQLGPQIRRIIVGNYLVYYELAPEAAFVLRALHSARGVEDLTLD